MSETPRVDGADVPRLARGVRLRVDRLEGKPLLLRPEQGFELRGSALDVVRLCDGVRNVDQIVTTLCETFARATPAVGAARSARTVAEPGEMAGGGAAAAALSATIAEDVWRLLRVLVSRSLLELSRAPSMKEDRGSPVSPEPA